MSTQTAPAAPAAAAPAAGAPTHVTAAQSTGYQPSVPAAQPAVVENTPKSPELPGGDPKIQLAVDKPADPAVAKPSEPVAPAVEPAKAADPAAPEFKLPDEYKDKPWASKIKTQDDLYKQIDSLNALVGKKAVVPNLKEATPEEREAFYSQLRGKDAAEYVIPINPAFPTPADTQPVVAKLFMDNGVSPTQADAIIKGYQELGAKQLAEQYNPDGFKAAMTTAFGVDWEKTTGQVRNTIKGMMNADDAKALDTVPNNLLGVVYRTLGNVVKAYGIKETDSAHFATTGKAAPTDVNSLRQGLRDKLNSLSMRPHTSAEQQSIIDELNATYTHDPRLQQQG